MKYAIISDIHSNYEALKSTLENIKKQNVNKIICLGDIIGKGENSHKCIELVKSHCDIVVAGNTDIRFSTADAEDFKDNELEYKRIVWNQKLLSPEDFEYLRSLPICYEFEVGEKLVRMFHATPSDAYGFINDYDTDLSRKYEMFLPSKFTTSQRNADVVIYGHLHYQYLSTIYNKTIISCGSVGNPICLIQNDERNSPAENICKAQYLILETDDENNISYCFKSVNYDIEAELRTNKTNIEFENYKIELTRGRYRNMARVKKSFEVQGYDTSKF